MPLAYMKEIEAVSTVIEKYARIMMHRLVYEP